MPMADKDAGCGRGCGSGGGDKRPHLKPGSRRQSGKSFFRWAGRPLYERN